MTSGYNIFHARYAKRYRCCPRRLQIQAWCRLLEAHGVDAVTRTFARIRTPRPPAPYQVEQLLKASNATEADWRQCDDAVSKIAGDPLLADEFRAHLMRGPLAELYARAWDRGWQGSPTIRAKAADWLSTRRVAEGMMAR